VVLGVAAGPTVVVLIGCNVDNTHLPGLPNELPNRQGAPSGPVTGTHTSSGTTSSSTAPITGPALNECDCAAAVLAASPSCLMCQNQTCMTVYTHCAATDCPMAATCVKGCNNSGPCIAGCIDMYPGYQGYMQCLFYNGCAPSCGVTASLSCPRDKRRLPRLL